MSICMEKMGRWITVNSPKGSVQIFIQNARSMECVDPDLTKPCAIDSALAGHLISLGLELPVPTDFLVDLKCLRCAMIFELAVKPA